MTGIEAPDFPTLFHRSACSCAVCSDSPSLEHDAACPAAQNPLLTSRAALHLWVAAELLEDECRQALEDAVADPIPADTPFLTRLPPNVMQNVTRVWFERFAASFGDLRDRLGRGLLPSPNCTGEEVALHLMLDRVASDASDEMLVVPDRFEELYPTYLDEDLDVDWWREVLLEDADVTLLWNPAYDGIDEPELMRELRLANLRPEQWFLPFR